MSVPPLPVRSLFQRMESGAFDSLTTADDLTAGLVALLEARARCSPSHGASRAGLPSSDAAPIAAASTAAAASTPAIAASSGPDGSLSASASSHLFALLSRYPQQCNRIARYLSIDSDALWAAVRRQSKFALHSSEAVSGQTDTAAQREPSVCVPHCVSRDLCCALWIQERVEHDSISFERGDSETRVRLVLTELRQIARALRRQKTTSSNERATGAPAASATAASANLPTPQKSIALSRASSLTPMQQLPLPSAAAPAAPSFCSPLLTHPLFADELSHILPVLFLRCTNDSSGTSGLTDDEDDPVDAHDRGPQVDLTERFAQGAASDDDDDGTHDQDMEAKDAVPSSRRSLFMPLRDLVHVLLHQGPVHAPRFLTLLSFAKPHSLPAILDACFDLLRAQLVCVEEKLHASSQTLPSLMRDPQLLSKGVLRVWRQSFLLMHSAPFSGLFASLLSLASLDLPHSALGIRMRVVQMMDQLKLTPPALAIPPPSSSAAAPSQSLIAAPAPATAAATTASASATATASAPSGPLSTPVRLRASPLPPPLSAQVSAARPVTPLFNATASANTQPGTSTSASPAPAAAATPAASASASASVSIATPAVLASLLCQCWAPLSHYLPRLALGVTLQLLRDPSSFLASVVARANAPPWTPKVSDAMAAASVASDESSESRSSSSAHRMLEYLRDHRLSEEYSDLIGSAMQAAHQATVTAAANAAAQKERLRLAAEAAAPVRGKKKLLKQQAKRAKEAAAAALTVQQMEQQPAESQPAASKTAPSTPLSNRAGGPSTSPSLSAHKSSGAQSQSIPAITSNSPQRNAQLHAGFSSPTLHSVQYREGNAHKAPTHPPRSSSGSTVSVDFIHPSARSSVEAALSLYRIGSVDHLRAQLFANFQLLGEQHAQQVEQIRQHSIAAFSSVCSGLARLLQLYCQLMLHCQFHLRTRELQLVHQLIPPVEQADAALAVVSSAPALLAVVSRLHQLVLAVLCICPVATGSSSTCGWQVSLQTLLRLKRWMADAQCAVVQRAASQAGADQSLEGVSNLLLQFGIASQHSKAGEINYLLRALLRLPLSFKPALLHPHSVSSHLREMQFGLLQAHVWPKFEVLPAVFSLDWIRPDGSGPPSALLLQDARGMLHLRSSSPLLARALSTRIDHAYHLLRPTPAAVQSLVPRPYFEFGVGFWLSSLLRIAAAAAPDPAVPPLSLCLTHPLLCHASILPLLDSVAQFDLSAAILEQQQAQSQGQVRPAHQRRDQRAIKEEEMRDMLHMHLHNGGSSTLSLPCVPDLRNPIGLVLCVYYLLSYNSLAFQLSWKCLPPAPEPRTRSLLDSNDEHEDAEQVTAPDAPFAPALAQSISVASAVAPYPPHLCDGVPLRGILEFIKRLRVHSKKQEQARTGAPMAAASSAVATAAANVSSLYVSLYRLLLQLHPESLIGFDVSCESDGADDVRSLQSLEMRTEGAIHAITEQEPTTTTMHRAVEEERANPMSPAEITASISRTGSPQLSRALEELQHLIFASSTPLSSYADSFLLHVLRPLCRVPSSPLHSAVERVWLSFYSSGLSSSEWVARTLHCLLVDAEEGTASHAKEPRSWIQFDPCGMSLDPMQLLLLAPSRVLCAPSLFRVFLICLYHSLVASSSYCAVLGKSEYVSLQLLTQSLHHSTHAGWTHASKLLAPAPNPHERKSLKEVEPMTLYIHAHIDKIISAQQQAQGPNDASKRTAAQPSLQREITPTTVPASSPSPVSAAAVAGDSVAQSDPPPSKKQRLQDPGSSSSSSPIAPDDRAMRDEEVDGEQKTPFERQSDAMHDTVTAATDEVSSAPSAVPVPSASAASSAPPLSSSSSSSSSPSVFPPRPHSFLVSDRVLSPGEQLVFSADFALAMPTLPAAQPEVPPAEDGRAIPLSTADDDDSENSEIDSDSEPFDVGVTEEYMYGRLPPDVLARHHAAEAACLAHVRTGQALDPKHLRVKMEMEMLAMRRRRRRIIDRRARAAQERKDKENKRRQAQADALSPDPLSTPTLRVFAYLLTTRAAIAQQLLDHALCLLRTVPLPNADPATGVSSALCCASASASASFAPVSECVSVVFSFLGLLFRASSPPSSQSPSSLLLLLHVQSYPCALLPLFCTHFESQLRPLLQEGLLRDRIQAGVGESTQRATQARRRFMAISTIITQQQDRHRQQIKHKPEDRRNMRSEWDALRRIQAQQPRSAMMRDWMRTAVLFPRMMPLLTDVTQQMITTDATLF